MAATKLPRCPRDTPYLTKEVAKRCERIRKAIRVGIPVAKHRPWEPDPVMCEVTNDIGGRLAHCKATVDDTEWYLFAYGETDDKALNKLEAKVRKYFMSEAKRAERAFHLLNR